VSPRDGLLLKNWLIQQNLQDPEPLDSLRGRVANRIFGFLTAKSISLFVVLSIVFAPIVSNAGAFSFVLALFGRGQIASPVVALDASVNSQNIKLLDAPLNIDPNAGKGGGEITIVGDSALLYETGPTGSLANIEDVPKSDQISVYVVREGDTLSQIASLFSVTTNTVLWANDVPRSGVIREGQKLIILPISGVRHSVQKGETLRSIVKEYKGDLDEVLAYNSLSADSILSVGDVLVIPDGEIAPIVRTSSSIVSGSTSGPSYNGYYLRPISGGKRTQGPHGYNGIDLGTYAGAPIFAAAEGTVIISKNSGWNGGYGLYVVVRHDNGTQTLYAHNSQNIVYPGQYVVRGQVIGYVGSTGRSTGPHLHFEVRGAKNPF